MKPTYILGLNSFHADASAVLLRDGQLVAAVAEERLNRVKHFAGFPALAVRAVLAEAGIGVAAIDHLAINKDSRANLLAKLKFAVGNLGRITRMARQRLEYRARADTAPQLICAALGVPESQLRARVHHVEHHLCHAASSFLVSPFDTAAIMSVDGFGDFASTLTAQGTGNAIHVYDRTLFPHSLGVLYTMVCQFIGFDQYGDEGKVMGLAPYGEPEYLDFFHQLVRLLPEGRFELNLDYFLHHREGVDYAFDAAGRPTVAPLFSDQMSAQFGPPRARDAELTARDKNLAASLQRTLEAAYVHLASHLHKVTRSENLCLAGGVALNSVANGLLLERTGFKNIYVQPAAGDDGTALGAACWVQHHVLQQPRCYTMASAATGNEFSDEEIGAALAAAGITAERLDEPALIERAAQAIARSQVVGWFQGRMEWGPRALGNRSILAHPGDPQMKDILNARIKHREWFRPFAPAILAERLGDYFESQHPSPFMLMVYRTRPEMAQRLCAVDHVDHTGRVQTVTHAANPKFYRLIVAFERLTGLPVVLNTSFNENEPIVCTPAEAIDCFLRTRMDALAIGNYFCTKSPAA